MTPLERWLADVALATADQLDRMIAGLSSVWHTEPVTIATPPCRLHSRSRQTTTTHEIKSYEPGNTPDDL